MKEYIAETGGRYTYSDDILNLAGTCPQHERRF